MTLGTRFKSEKKIADKICGMLREEAKKRKIRRPYGRRYSMDQVDGYKVKLYNIDDTFEVDFKKVIDYIEKLGWVHWFNDDVRDKYTRLYAYSYLRSFIFKFKGAKGN